MAFAIYGTGGFAREVAPVVAMNLRQKAQATPVANSADIVFVDDADVTPSEVNGYAVIDFEALKSENHKHRKVVVAIGDGAVRRKIEERCVSAGLTLASVQSASSRVMDDVEIGAGAIICDQVILTSNIKVGRSFQANLYSYVAHDCVVGDYVTFAPRVSVNGNVVIGDDVYIGTGAMIIQGTPSEPISIGRGAVIGMGSVVTKSVPERTLVVGNPARAIKTFD